MIDYQNITDNEIKRIVACAADPAAQVLILKDLTGKSVADIKRAAGIPLTEEDELEESNVKSWGWSEADLQFLRDNRERPVKEQALKLGKSSRIIDRMRRELGICVKPRWDKKSTDRLIRMYKKGIDQRVIAEKLGRSYGSVVGKISYLRQQDKL